MEKTQSIYKYEPLTEADMTEMFEVMPGAADERYIDIVRVIPRMLEKKYGVRNSSWTSTHLSLVYNWGVIQGQRMERAKLETIAEMSISSEEMTVVARLLREIEFRAKEDCGSKAWQREAKS